MPLYEPHIQSIFAGTSSATGPGVSLANGGGISFGVSGNTISATGDFVRSISAGASNATGNQVVFQNANGISFGALGNTITASVAAVGDALSIMVFSQRGFDTNYMLSNAIVSFQKVSLAAGISGALGLYLLDVSAPSTVSGAFSISFGAYSVTGSLASAVVTTFAGFTWASSAYTAVSGTRLRSFPWPASLPPGDYMFGMAGSMAPNVSAKIFGRQGFNLVGAFAGIETAYFLDGVSASSAFVLPVSLVVTDLGYIRTGISAAQQPGVILIGTS